MKTISTKQMAIVGGLLGMTIVGLVVLLIRSNSEMAEMTQVFGEERENLVNEYEDLYTQYDGMRSDNDSLNNLLVEQRERVAQLSDELQTLKASNARRIKELQAELGTLRTVMRSFIVQIDSLNQKNVILTKENDNMRKEIASMNDANATLNEQNKALSQKVSIAARLEAINITTIGLSDREKETSKPAKIAKIKTSFTLDKNVSASVGIKTVYLRITRPDGQLLMHSLNDKFVYEDTDLNFSAKRDVEYGGEELATYIVYVVDAGELTAGTYDVEIFCEGERIGKSAFTL